MLSFLHHQRCSWLRLTSECVGVGACVGVFLDQLVCIIIVMILYLKGKW